MGQVKSDKRQGTGGNWFDRSFKAEVKQAGESLNPFRGGLLFAREIAYPDLNPVEADAELDRFAAEIGPAVAAEADISGQVAALSEYVFDRLGFAGNREAYYDPANSYLNKVLTSRRGIPISLSVILVELARRVGLSASGIGLPGHFIVAVEAASGGDLLYLDPYNGGAPLTMKDCERLVRESTGYEGPLEPDWLRPAPARAIVGRMLNNLRGIYLHHEQWGEAEAVIRALRSLEPEVPEHSRDLGLVLHREHQLRGAIAMLEEYLARKPDAPDFEQVRQSLWMLAEHLGRLN